MRKAYEERYAKMMSENEAKKLTKEQRHEALHKLIKHFIPIKGEMAAYNYVIRALNARYILNRNTNRKTAKIFKQDQREFSKEYAELKKQSKKMM